MRDPRASLGPLEVTATIGGHTVTVPPVPAAVWLDVLLDPAILVSVESSAGPKTGVSTQQVLDGILRSATGVETHLLLLDAVTDGELDPDELDRAARDLLTELSGRPWYQAINLCAVLLASWDHVGGRMALGGVDPGRLSLGAWLDAAYWTMIQAVAEGEDGRQRAETLIREISREPVEVGPGGEVDDASMDEQEFLAAAALM